ncbi:hypothetical protein DNL40_07865 [Xylanimonas oleitrophica]|uniref:Uncharacterized protein n=1 Tax=Xylanimonas oleitrophica TaxID=2607479 RepID=A0A2W5XTK2_9MICO|nr:hypothetical protein [Xylanimonas oleitrophica]PZR53418.1 hypothetical protein DNL40_07865 [Xylanimonas oleitrophica]
MNDDEMVQRLRQMAATTPELPVDVVSVLRKARRRQTVRAVGMVGAAGALGLAAVASALSAPQTPAPAPVPAASALPSQSPTPTPAPSGSPSSSMMPPVEPTPHEAEDSAREPAPHVETTPVAPTPTHTAGRPVALTEAEAIASESALVTVWVDVVSAAESDADGLAAAKAEVRSLGYEGASVPLVCQQAALEHFANGAQAGPYDFWGVPVYFVTPEAADAFVRMLERAPAAVITDEVFCDFH